ncbi:YaeQ family protein, partial [Acinetobacter baumannii]
VQVWQLAPESTAELEQLCERTMQLQLNVMDNEWTLLSDKGQANVVWTQLQ